MGVRERGALVRRGERTLRGNGAAKVFEHGGQTLYVAHDFVSAAECEHICALIRQKNEPSGTLGEAYPMFSDFRTSSTSHLPPDDPVVQAVDARISDLLGMRNDLAESTQGQLYRAGQTFRAHYDYFHTESRHWRRASREGGQRVWTAMAYLNDRFEGGETRFTEAKFAVTPRAGTLVVWNNMTAEGQPNPLSMHEGAPVISGEKAIITRWYRERTWQTLPFPPGAPQRRSQPTPQPAEA